MEKKEIEEKQKEFFAALQELCEVWSKYPAVIKQRSVREVFEKGVYLWGVAKYNGQKTKFAYVSHDVQEGTHLHYEHVVPVNFFLSYFKDNIQQMSFERFSEIISENCEVCGVSDDAEKKLKIYRDTMPAGWQFGGNKWQRYVECGIEVKDSEGKTVKID